MKILVLHNRYQQAGGEDTVVRAEMALLRDRGDDVELLEENNDGIGGAAAALLTVPRAIYSVSARQKVAQRIREFQPDVVHVHNFFPRFSPSVYDACAEAGVPVVQTLHNYRLLCLNSYLFRDGHTCEDCITSKSMWPGVRHRCYRDSLGASAAIASMITVHRARQTWTRKVDTFIALTEFARDKFVQSGLPAEKIFVKPNFMHSDPGMASGGGDYALFAGRLSPEKGVSTLLEAWRTLPGNCRLKIAGDGPLGEEVAHAAKAAGNIEWLGRCSGEPMTELMKSARFLVFPSQWYEGFPMVIAEALGAGTPVLASRIGGLPELIAHRRTGLLVEPGNVKELSAAVAWAFEHPEEIAAMRKAARAEYEAKYTASRNYEILMSIYQRVLGRQVSESCASVPVASQA